MTKNTVRLVAASVVALAMTGAGASASYAADERPATAAKTAIEQKKAELSQLRSEAKTAADARKKEAESRKAAAALYMQALEKYKADLATWTSAHKSINDTFKSAVQKAQSDYAGAVAGSADPSVKQSAQTARKAAITAATTARQQALTTLGTKPVKPAAPAKSSR